MFINTSEIRKFLFYTPHITTCLPNKIFTQHEHKQRIEHSSNQENELLFTLTSSGFSSVLNASDYDGSVLKRN